MRRLPRHTDPGVAPIVAARVPSDVIERLDELARQRGVKRSELVREAVETALRREEGAGAS